MSATVEQIEGVIQAWLDAYEAKDVEALLDLAVGDEVQLVGTGADEMRFGLDGYRAQAERDFAQSDELRVSVANLRVSTVGDAGFVCCEAHVSASAGGETSDLPGLRMTAGLVRTDQGWRLAQVHLSAPASGQQEGSSF